MDTEKILTRFGLSPIWKSLRENYHLWESPFKELCRKAEAAGNEPIPAVIERADAAMYRAKQAGRNRVEMDG